MVHIDCHQRAAASEQELMKLALEACGRAYAPYSQFQVGAAVLLSDGGVATGCNVENASYGLSICAERVAIFQAVSRGNRQFAALAVAAHTEGAIAPCGACRQVMAEFMAPHAPVYLGNTKGDIERTTVGRLLPDAFHWHDF